MYSILIKIEGIEKRKRSASLVHIIVGLFLITKAADYYRLTNYHNFIPLIPIYLIALISLLYGFFRKRFDYTAKYNPAVRIMQVMTFTVLGILLIHIGRPIDYLSCFLWAALGLMLFFTERKIYNDTNLLIDNKGLIIPGYYANHQVAWDKLAEIVVRQDYVTIFHKNNKYLQYQVLQSLSDLEIAQINGFCKERISAVEQDTLKQNINIS